MQKNSDRMHQILFGWSSTPDPTGELTALPRPLAAEEGLAALSQEPTLDLRASTLIVQFWKFL